jgi:hypothetical protein
MKDLKELIIKIILSAIVLTIAFIYFEKKPPVENRIFFDTKKQTTTTNAPSQLQWYDSFKGVENLPSKPKIDPDKNK